MSEREEFLRFALLGEVSMSELSRRFGVSRKTGYKWLSRGREQGIAGLADQSRRPLSSPCQTPAPVVGRVRMLRQEHPAWGGRKLHHVLNGEGLVPLPAPSTINSILKREGLLSRERREKRDWQRFEAPGPNALWQMDFKGPIQLSAGKAHALTILDDHSRFNLCLAVCPDQQRETVMSQLVRVFERYGLPDRMLMDNGSPWGSAGQTEEAYVQTRLSTWLIRLGIGVIHGRPYHPQTQGKDERFHRTLNLEVLAPRAEPWRDAAELQGACNDWRDDYNLRRPHEALGNQPPVSRYQPSPRSYPSVLPAVEYNSGEVVRRVHKTGKINFLGRIFTVGKGLADQPVALRATTDSTWDVYFCQQRIRTLDLTRPEDV